MRFAPSSILALAAVLITSLGIPQALNVPPSAHQSSFQRSLNDAPSLRLRVFLKRATMQLHGQGVFDMFAKPSVSDDGTMVRYDAFTKIIDGDSQFLYMLVNGTTYAVEGPRTSVAAGYVQCLPPVLSAKSFISALNDAMVVPRASIDGDEVQCTDGTLLKTSLGDPNFVICAAGASGFTAYSRDMAVGVEYMDRSIKTMSAPEVTDQSASCNRADDDYTSVTSTGLALLTGNTIPAGSSRNLKEATHIVIDEETCSCKSTPRPCIFFHGLGNPNEEAELQDSPKKTKRKMGEIKGHAPCCSTIKYAVLNTVDYAWTNSTLQQKFCDHALSISDTSDLTSMTIEDTVIVTHSMGGLVMAGALANEKCKFGENTFWASLSAPMTGTMTVDYLQDFCNGEKGKFMVEVLDLIGECPVSTSRKSISYQNEKYSSPELNAAYIAAQEAYRGNVTAALCSNHYAGVVSLYQVPAIVAGKIIPHKSREGDGYVEFQSCAGGLPASMFGNSYKDKFYATELNHADTAFLTHDGLFKDSQKPAKWFECLL